MKHNTYDKLKLKYTIHKKTHLKYIYISFFMSYEYFCYNLLEYC